jgi:hypothetical protein
MKRNFSNFIIAFGILAISFSPSTMFSALREESVSEKMAEPGTAKAASDEAMMEEVSTPKESVKYEEEEPVKATPTKKPAQRIERANAFIAGADWEFDGFVSGGYDQEVRTMFYQNDLVYLNIGSQQGINTGDRITIYKRGEKIRDPQSGRFIGYEVRKAAVAKATDKVGDETSSVRILQSNEAVEIGDLIRRE